MIGITMLWMRLRGTLIPSTGFAVLHGIFAVVALVIIIATVADGGARSTHLAAAMILFSIATLGGLILFLGYHIRKRPLPLALMWAHGILALIAFFWMVT
ncbi:MAG: hypothetical protein Q8922_06845 [Bacteroidota bacterium]|nr:hypothetical protein [Bacteroidota bacterium]MDP4287636.1 hypothetical protein [Bacteroidota bacterium]